MNCHCGTPLTPTIEIGYSLACPQCNSALVIKDNNIQGYRVIIGDYKVEVYSHLNFTTLHKGRIYCGFYNFLCIFFLNEKLPLPIKDGQLQSSLLLEKLKMLMVFS